VTNKEKLNLPENPKRKKKPKNVKKPGNVEELLRSLDKGDDGEDEEDDLEGDEPLTFGTSSNPSTAPVKKSGYVPGQLNKCGNVTCDKKEQTENQFKLCSRCKKACYCTIECQRKAWRKHKTQCQKL